MVYNSMTGTSSHLRGPSLYRALSLLLIIFILFPFLTFINIDTDIQPYALVLSIVVFIIEKDRRLPIPIALLLIPLLFSLCLLAIYGISFHAMRSVANYASLFFISAASYFVLQKTDKKHIGRILAIVTYSWFAVGMIQHFIDYEFMRL